MRVEEAAAAEAAEQGARDQRGPSCARCSKSMRGRGLFAAFALATWAAAMTVERVELLPFGRQFVLVAFEQLQGELGIHHLEVHFPKV